MRTEEIAKALKLTAQLMELHEENPFKVKSIANAAYKLDKTDLDLAGKSLDELEKIEGIGKGIAAKIHEMQTTGHLNELDALLEKTPLGVIDLLGVKGIGPKKVRQLWMDLGVESIGELLYACNENRLLSLKGFGEKTQTQLKKQIEFHLSNTGKFHYASVEGFANELLIELQHHYPGASVSLTGAMRRKNQVIDDVQLLINRENAVLPEKVLEQFPINVSLLTCEPAGFYLQLFQTTATPEHLNLLGTLKKDDYASEEAIYASYGLPFIVPELREGLQEVELARKNKLPELIEFSDLKGVLHNHTTYSDGMNTLEEMAIAAKDLGYQYLGICDHSQSAFYANGLKADRIREQHAEMDRLNKQHAPFRIFKGIESDILNDGSLDYPDEVLKGFDFIVASIHSNLKMEKEKATQRLIRAIENPYTTILGHPTGRLLLSREGYPIDHKKVIDACAANGVVMELNAHPYRLDIDWHWIPYCLEKGVMISINPDAHEKSGYHDMLYGVNVARKGMLTADRCLNAMSLEQIDDFFTAKKK